MMRIVHNGRKIAMYLPDVVTWKSRGFKLFLPAGQAFRVFSSIGLELPKSGCSGATL